MNDLTTAIGLAIFLSVCIERVSELLVATPLELAFGKEWKYRAYTVQSFAFAIGCIVTVLARLDVVSLIASSIGYAMPESWGAIGFILTGFVIGGGSNLVSDIFSKFVKK